MSPAAPGRTSLRQQDGKSPIADGRSLGEHASPGEATLQVLRGSVRPSAESESWHCGTGDHLVIPPQRHDLTALEDAVVLLTVATRA